MVDLIHKEITSKIIAASFEVSNTLGTGFLEKVYENALKYEMELAGLEVQQQKQVFVFYKGCLVGKYQVDLLIEDNVIVEVKTVEKIIPAHKAQLINYLKATGLQLGLIINFYHSKVEYYRIVLERSNPR